MGLLLGGTVSPAKGAELKVYPSQVVLTPEFPSHQVVVVEEEQGRVLRDRTAEAHWTVSSDQVVRWEDGSKRLVALGNGEDTLTATVGQQQAVLRVVVQGMDRPARWSFQRHVLPTLTRLGCNSGACHGALAGKGGLKLSLRGFDPNSDYFVLTRQALGRRLDLVRPEDSLLLKKATRQVPHGGGRRVVVGDDHYQLLLRWIAAGAPGPDPAETPIVRLEVLPKQLLLAPKQQARLLVRAYYQDGTVVDVTPWARFVSSHEPTAGVDDTGLVTSLAPGVAGIVVGFDTLVAVATVTVPFPPLTEEDQRRLQQAPRYNLVDVHIQRTLELLRLPPSPPCSDATFLRRVYLDLLGRLPTPEEAQDFLQTSQAQRPDKRQRLVDTLLERPEYVDYWSHKWSDLFLVSTRKLPEAAMWSYYRRIRRAVADNEPWDRFVRDLLTASGSNLHNGGGNYFVLHKDVSELAEATAVTFLGFAIGCAKCHNHPLEKWTQDDYWAFANLFAQVALKSGDRAAEVLVNDQPEGEALHPRRGIALRPRPLDGPPLPADYPSTRRHYFALWLTAADNPYFAKAIVNRLWRHFMGRGLVEPDDDLRASNPPTHPELLDALAAELVKHNYDLKHIMRLILNSAAYQRDSQPLPANAADDRFYSRYYPRRLPAEVLLDAYADVTGVPTPFRFVKSAAGDALSATSSYPLGTRAVQIPDALVASYFLEAFGRPERMAVCSCERSSEASVTQALHLNNGQTLNDKLRDPNNVIARWLRQGKSDAEIIERLYWHALTRPPREHERQQCLALLANLPPGPDARREILEDLTWALLTSREFLFNH
ncbi:MAG: DUF1549 and DUF1553 domain-containing protein [Gemmataceae bacterium]|nr:DUF1549 and DUF1553 domain-containing protein [Gemmataceae bacterium]